MTKTIGKRDRTMKMKSKLNLTPQIDKMRTLWKANLRIQHERDNFLFTATEEFEQAARIAEKLLQSSASCRMVGAVIVGIERIDHLWN